MIFLIRYDRRAGEIKLLKRFDASERNAAEKARLDIELDLHRHPRDEEVVILEAESEAQIRRTHGRYFKTVEELIETSGVAR